MQCTTVVVTGLRTVRALTLRHGDWVGFIAVHAKELVTLAIVAVGIESCSQVVETEEIIGVVVQVILNHAIFERCSRRVERHLMVLVV
ncbi:Uncharacterised protein [Vibrio cholerae]|nr:Uncharacterised protein [Vibrio cholerae]CSA22929.1 Uncharacterised protein [Vibrio cholerae]CSA64701.1 Uncharacterised protein [Vibrio cholerae]CSA91107.1 Uncharacterised protein [Vibrio cholerae]CSB28222.1 Uncharacterised protein [Vibrio cholerae]